MNTIRTLFITIVMLGVSANALAQTENEQGGTPNIVSVDARGDDVRNVLYELFKQQGASFVVQTGVFYSLYLNLEEVPFEIALKHICHIAGLEYEIQDGIYIFKTSTPKTTTPRTHTSGTIQRKPVDPSELEKTLTLRLADNDIRTVMRAITAKTEVPIEVAEDVPALKVNAYFTGVTIREALNTITKAAGLSWGISEHGTLIVSKSKNLAITTTNTIGSTAGGNSVKGTPPACDQCGTTLGTGWKYCPICGNYVKPITSGG